MELLKTKKSEQPSTRVTDDPRYAAALVKLGEVQGHLTRLDRRKEELYNTVTPARDDLASRAEALLDGRSLDESMRLATEGARADVEAIDREQRVVREAVRLATERVNAERMRASREIVERLRPEHRRLVQAIAKRLEALSAALDEEEQFREALVNGDVLLGDLRPMPLPAARLAEPLDGDSPHAYTAASRWLRDARACGLL